MLEIQNMNEAIKIANEIERHEGALKQMKEALKEFVEANGPVDTGEKTWNFSESVSWNFEPSKLKELAGDIFLNGHNPWALLSIGIKELAKTGFTEAELRQYGTPKVTKRFGSKRTAVTAKSA